MKLKKGDQAKIILGKDRGKKGKIIQVFPEKGLVVIEGLNLRTKHTRPRKEREKGERVQFSAPLKASNVMLLCSKCNEPTRIGYKIIEKKRNRICRKCKEVI